MPTTAEARERAGGLVIRAGAYRWAVPFAAVIEVLREARTVRVPGGAPAVRGIVNHRGRILTVADPVRALDERGDPGGGRDVVVVEWDRRRFGLAVDGVVELAAEARTGLAEIDLERITRAIFA